jgi:hypothetical protein
MAYKKAYPSALNFELKDATVRVSSLGKTKYNLDLWGIKYLFDKGQKGLPLKVYINAEMPETMALRMYFLRYIFPAIEFHDNENDRFIIRAEEIIKGVGTKYITYKLSDCLLKDRGTKDKLESRIERELADNLSKYIGDFPVGVKVIRQFPANIFESSISEKNRVTDKLWIDMVSVNAVGELSPIELKVGGNIPLDLFAQGLDYGIFCYLFRRHINNNWFNRLGDTKQDKVSIYYIGEEFHPALVGRGKEEGVVSLVRKNAFFNIVFIQIAVDKTSQRITGKPKVIWNQ